MGAWGGRMWENDDAGDAACEFSRLPFGSGPCQKKDKHFIHILSNSEMMAAALEICATDRRQKIAAVNPWGFLGIAHYVLSFGIPLVRYRPFVKLVASVVANELFLADEWEKRANRPSELRKFWKAFLKAQKKEK